MLDKKRIVIAEDYTILREGIKSLLSNSPDLEVVGEAEDGIKAIKVISEKNPDLALMDLSMPRMNGMEAIREAKSRCTETKILVLTVHREEEYVFASLEAGADGYALKDASFDELLMAIKSVLRGRRYLSPEISGKVIDGYLKGGKEQPLKTSWDRLTKREREVLKLIAESYKNKEIADILCISLKTVEKHRDNLMKKMDLHSASELTAFAIEKGIVSR